MAQPEPCWNTSPARCYSTIACEAFGYCRNRNLLFGLPDEATAEQWRQEAIKAKKKQARINKQESSP